MSDLNIIRVWKDADYRSRLSPEEYSLLPENPAGLIELYDEDLQKQPDTMLRVEDTWAFTGDCCTMTGTRL